MTAEVELLPLPEGNVAHLIAAQAAEIKALRAEQEVIAAEAKKYAGESGRLKARVELLAEALRLAEEHIDFITPKWYSAGQRVLAAIRAALRDHDQENDDA